MEVKTKLKQLLNEIQQQYQRLNPSVIIIDIDQQSTQNQISDTSIIDNIINKFRRYTQNVTQHLKQMKSNQQYQKLQKALQVQQAEIRNHFRLQQQMKLYTDTLQSKLQDSENRKKQVCNCNTSTIQKLKKQIQQLQNQYQILKQKNIINLTHKSSKYSSQQRLNGSIRYDTENNHNRIYTTNKNTDNLMVSKTFIDKNNSKNLFNPLFKSQINQKNNKSTSRQICVAKLLKESTARVSSKKTIFGNK